jgi:hypothetical protein
MMPLLLSFLNTDAERKPEVPIASILKSLRRKCYDSRSTGLICIFAHSESAVVGYKRHAAGCIMTTAPAKVFFAYVLIIKGRLSSEFGVLPSQAVIDSKFGCIANHFDLFFYVKHPLCILCEKFNFTPTRYGAEKQTWLLTEPNGKQRTRDLCTSRRGAAFARNISIKIWLAQEHDGQCDSR